MAKLIVSINQIEDAERLQEVSSLIWGLKVHTLVLRHGAPKVIDRLKVMGFQNVFVDLKLRDIPEIMGEEVFELINAGADIVSVDGDAENRGLKVASAVASGEKKGRLACTTALSSDHATLPDAEIMQKMFESSMKAMMADIPMVIGNPRFFKDIAIPENDRSFEVITPGIRPEWYEGTSEGHVRTMTPYAAVEAGSDYLVVGRPITLNENPARAVWTILKEMSNGKGNVQAV